MVMSIMVMVNTRLLPVLVLLLLPLGNEPLVAVPGLGTFFLRKARVCRKRRRAFVELAKSQKAKVIKMAHTVIASICNEFCPGERMELLDQVVATHRHVRGFSTTTTTTNPKKRSGGGGGRSAVKGGGGVPGERGEEEEEEDDVDGGGDDDDEEEDVQGGDEMLSPHSSGDGGGGGGGGSSHSSAMEEPSSSLRLTRQSSSSSSSNPHDWRLFPRQPSPLPPLPPPIITPSAASHAFHKLESPDHLIPPARWYTSTSSPDRSNTSSTTSNGSGHTSGSSSRSGSGSIMPFDASDRNGMNSITTTTTTTTLNYALRHHSSSDIMTRWAERNDVANTVCSSSSSSSSSSHPIPKEVLILQKLRKRAMREYSGKWLLLVHECYCI